MSDDAGLCVKPRFFCHFLAAFVSWDGINTAPVLCFFISYLLSLYVFYIFDLLMGNFTRVFVSALFLFSVYSLLSCGSDGDRRWNLGDEASDSVFSDSIASFECKGSDVSSYLDAGDRFYEQGNYTNALECYVKGLKHSERSGDCKNVADFYKNIGNIYSLFEDYERGSTYYKKGLSYSRSCKNKETERKILINLTGISIFMGNLREARVYYKELTALGCKYDDVADFMGRYNFGLILLEEKKYRAAVDVYRSLAACAVQKKMSGRYLCSTYQQIYKACRGLGRNDSALHYMKKCETLVRKCNMQHLFIKMFNDFSDFYEKTGDMAKSQAYKTRYLTLKDSIYNMREFDVVKHAQFLYEMDKIEKEISGLNTQKEEYRRVIVYQRVLIGVIVLVVLFVCGFLLFIYRQKERLDASYASLYSVNRKFVERHEQIEQRCRGYIERIRERDEEITRLNEKYGSMTANPVGGAKYQSSGLSDSQKQKLVDAITDVMENRKEFCSGDFSLEKLVELTGSNTKYVSQVINETYSKNFSNFVNEYRVSLACVRLADIQGYGNYTIKAISESVGFKSYSTFNSVFRKITGITPVLYKKMAQRDENGK